MDYKIIFLIIILLSIYIINLKIWNKIVLINIKRNILSLENKF